MNASTPVTALQIPITMQKYKAFLLPEKASDYDSLGMLCAKYCEWNSDKMRKVIYSMLEDANFHTLNAQIKELWEGKKEVVK